jgi:hypothetical protein
MEPLDEALEFFFCEGAAEAFLNAATDLFQGGGAIELLGDKMFDFTQAEEAAVDRIFNDDAGLLSRTLGAHDQITAQPKSGRGQEMPLLLTEAIVLVRVVEDPQRSRTWKSPQVHGPTHVCEQMEAFHEPASPLTPALCPCEGERAKPRQSVLQVEFMVAMRDFKIAEATHEPRCEMASAPLPSPPVEERGIRAVSRRVHGFKAREFVSGQARDCLWQGCHEG